MRDMSGTAKDTDNSGIGEGATASIGSEGNTANAILQHHFSHHPALICAWIGGKPAV